MFTVKRLSEEQNNLIAKIDVKMDAIQAKCDALYAQLGDDVTRAQERSIRTALLPLKKELAPLGEAKADVARGKKRSAVDADLRDVIASTNEMLNQ